MTHNTTCSKGYHKTYYAASNEACNMVSNIAFNTTPDKAGNKHTQTCIMRYIMRNTLGHEVKHVITHTYNDENNKLRNMALCFLSFRLHCIGTLAHIVFGNVGRLAKDKLLKMTMAATHGNRQHTECVFLFRFQHTEESGEDSNTVCGACSSAP